MDKVRQVIKAYFPKPVAESLRAANAQYWDSIRSLRILSQKVRSGLTTNYSSLERLKLWVPFSANWWRYPDLTIENANSYPGLFLKLAATFGDPLERSVIPDAASDCRSPQLAARIAEAMSRHGSDKSTKHDYHFFYSNILLELGVENELDILEIGLGTNSDVMISSMGKLGTPGASLRAFREILPHAALYGADIDVDILFQEERIATGMVDQLDPQSFLALVEKFKKDSFALIIDDGLHAVNANMQTLIFARNHLKEGGLFVVEDIAERALGAWYPVIWLLQKNACRCGLVRCKDSLVFWLKG